MYRLSVTQSCDILHQHLTHIILTLIISITNIILTSTSSSILIAGIGSGSISNNAAAVDEALLHGRYIGMLLDDGLQLRERILR